LPDENGYLVSTLKNLQTDIAECRDRNSYCPIPIIKGKTPFPAVVPKKKKDPFSAGVPQDRFAIRGLVRTPENGPF